VLACEAGLKVFEIDAMDFVDVLLQIEGYHKRDQNEWERARVIAFAIHSHSMAKNKSKRPEKYLPFPWDKKEVAPGKWKTEDERVAFYNQRRKEIDWVIKKNSQLNGG
jgi:hypothetical protein